eukprot:IDg6005t1
MGRIRPPSDTKMNFYFIIEWIEIHFFAFIVSSSVILFFGHCRLRNAPSTFTVPVLVLLKYLGTFGSGASNKSLATHFRIGKGTTELYRSRALTAVLSLEESSYYWPSADERRQISKEIQLQWYFPNCVGLMDGTLLPLENRPTMCGETYYTRKGSYAIQMLIVCNHIGKILYYVVGWPGSVHDNQVWRNSKLKTKA